MPRDLLCPSPIIMIRIQTIIGVIVKTVAVILIRILIGIIRLSEYNLSCHSHIVPPMYQNMTSRTPESSTLEGLVEG